MPHRAITALQERLRPHVGLGKSRLETLCVLIIGMISSRTVNLSHLASERPGEALIASTYRRLQRFFQHVRLPADWSAPLVIRLLGLEGSWQLALDRTQWKGRRQGRQHPDARRHHPASLLIVDEIGYLPITPGGANLFFQLVNARYEKGAMILTSNRGFAEWGEVFGDPVVATALLDRLLHHAVVIQIEGASYRLRAHADLIPSTSAPMLPSPRRQLRLWFASMAYVLLSALRRRALGHTELARATCGTIRSKLFKIGALVTVSVRRVRVAMASACPYAAVFRLAHRRLCG